MIYLISTIFYITNLESMLRGEAPKKKLKYLLCTSCFLDNHFAKDQVELARDGGCLIEHPAVSVPGDDHWLLSGECWSDIELKADVSPLQRRLLSGRTRRCAGRHARMAIHNMATHY